MIGLSTALVAEHGGRVPADMDALVALPGRRPQDRQRRARSCPGRARAAGRSPRAARRRPARVDPHRRRREGRGGQLTALWPRERWTRASDTLILHGRRICRPTPQCPICHARTLCAFAITGAATTAGRRRAARRRRAPPRPRPRAARRRSRARAAGHDPRAVPRARRRRHRLDPGALRQPRSQRRRSSSRRRRRPNCSPRWTSTRPTRCSASTRGRRSPSGAGITATTCPIACCSSSGRSRRTRGGRRRGRRHRRDAHPRARPLLRHERRRDHGDRGSLLARRARARTIRPRTTRRDARAQAVRSALPRAGLADQGHRRLPGRRPPTPSSRSARAAAP